MQGRQEKTTIVPPSIVSNKRSNTGRYDVDNSTHALRWQKYLETSTFKHQDDSSERQFITVSTLRQGLENISAPKVSPELLDFIEFLACLRSCEETNSRGGATTSPPGSGCRRHNNRCLNFMMGALERPFSISDQYHL